MANNPRNRENLTSWEKGKSGNPNGRPKSRVPGWIAEALEVKKAKKKEALREQELKEMEEYLLTGNIDEIKAVAKSSTVPMYFKAYAMALLMDGKMGRTPTIDKIRDRLFGMIEQRLTVSLEKRLENMTDEEVEKELARLKGLGIMPTGQE